MDFTRPDAVNTAVLNLILWRDRMGSTPMPAPKHTVFPQKGARLRLNTAIHVGRVPSPAQPSEARPGFAWNPSKPQAELRSAGQPRAAVPT